ncbi:hypothetical protein R1sor_014863 [Riccia sorocarpa]|uniref:Uncharacterized protein n=1 Tax=Riccia sorocarpa TaxID=122646 RepID=A0ABD3HEF5_9MARC
MIYERRLHYDLLLGGTFAVTFLGWTLSPALKALELENAAFFTRVFETRVQLLNGSRIPLDDFLPGDLLTQDLATRLQSIAYHIPENSSGSFHYVGAHLDSRVGALTHTMPMRSKYRILLLDPLDNEKIRGDRVRAEVGIEVEASCVRDDRGPLRQGASSLGGEAPC